jgi:hypothetical protein
MVPSSEGGRDVELAEAVKRNIVKNTTAKPYTLLRDMPDTLAKGFSVSEIIWGTDKTPWKSAAYKFCDP